jgi:putative N-acetylmannosamine-6-phosphate epimerase
MELSKGLIVSVQGYSMETTEELIVDIANAGAVAIRTDKKVNSRLPLIGLSKKKVDDRRKESYITCTLEAVKEIEKWTKIIAIDYRKINKEIKKISEYCKEKKLNVIADISNIEDYENIMENDYYHTYIATTLSVLLNNSYKPDYDIIKELKNEDCKNIIAEGNYSTRWQVIQAYNMGVDNVCIGGAISDVFRLTRKFTTIRINK